MKFEEFVAGLKCGACHRTLGRRAGRAGSGPLSSWREWEVDTCGENALEKQVLRAYGFHRVIQQGSVSCKALEELNDKNRGLASEISK